ncbi:MAG TPA: FGGY-family carbohydrate kinase [Nocardioides sp.]|uniref:xylulokinase n=1 Tax=Nocardioides sp. TaxID=35761 RepID=UPI002E33B700|nr:FGGY-family carbohydrate kinase [Nocardioides sp.]HEX5087934.1 FGGY-family carbohydrate kinase [Nocardioides sp.]
MTLGSVVEGVRAGDVVLGIELGSTRIKACLVAADDVTTVLATGGHSWENELLEGRWTYSLTSVWSGLQDAYADLAADLDRRHGVPLEGVRAIGVSAMMHGYLAFDRSGELLVPFRTWRNTSTGPAAAALTELFGVNIPLRWSVAHLYQAVLDDEPHVPDVRSITTLAGYVHGALTGRRVLGVGDASGMFPIDAATHEYDAELAARFDRLTADALPPVRELLPEVLLAGEHAGTLTAEGAALLDPSGVLRPGALLCPPEGDAGTGMVATNAVAPRTGNVSVGTSVFAMIVLDRELENVHEELDLVTTPAGDPVAMVHCNNGAADLEAWVGQFARFAQAAGNPMDVDAVFETLLLEALDGEPDAGGVLAYNHLAGEPVAGLAAGRPLVVRGPGSRFTLANLMRAHVYGVFATLAIGMRALGDEKVAIDRLVAHGGVFRTAHVAQRLLAAALDVPVAVGDHASEGGAWGVAVLASYAADGHGPLHEHLGRQVFARSAFTPLDPSPPDVAGFATYLDTYRAGLAVEAAAVDHL